jgi:hypothetical protein
MAHVEGRRDMEVIEELLSRTVVPKFAPVRQRFDAAHLDDLPEAVRAAVERSGTLSKVRQGASIAIGVGSRGIANLPVITRTVVELVREKGARPFIVPAMGSHGGATSEGQVAVLEHLGVTEASVGAPVRAVMEVLHIGSSAGGLPLYVDRNAAEADGIIAVNRIKPHTSFRGPVESGLLKMLVIGFGKQRGAEAAHERGFEYMATHILDLSAKWVELLPMLFGLAIIENAYGQTAKVAAIAPEQLREQEQWILEEARSLMPKITFNPLDVLIVDKIGKDISGVGMDPNVTGRYPNMLVKGDLSVSRIVTLRLSEATDGNAAGIGLADVTTSLLEGQIDRAKAYANSLTSTTMSTVKLPMVLPNDDLAIRAALKTSNAPDPGAVRAVRIRSTKDLGHIWVTEPLLDEARKADAVDILGPPEPLEFDAAGNLTA